MNYPPPPPGRRPRERGRAPLQEFAPTNVVMAHIGASRRRCMTFSEMIEKQAQGLTQLQMECQQMAGLIRHDPERLHRLGEWLSAVAGHLERGKRHLEEQIQVELFLQGECQHWLNGDEPTELPPPPPGFRRVMPPITSLGPIASGPVSFSTEEGYAVAPPHLLPRQPQFAPRESAPPRLAGAPSGPRLPAPAPASAVHQAPSVPAAAAAFAAYQKPQGPAAAPARAQYMAPPQRLPIVRLPVEQFTSDAPASTPQTNGPSSTVALEIEPIPNAEDEKNISPS
jgi:hypothetical protein